MSYIAPYITEEEYSCRHCRELPPDLNNDVGAYDVLFNAFRQIREEWGKGIPISSGYRCPDYNKQIGGNTISVHMFGLALDLDCRDTSEVDDLNDVIEAIAPELRRGVYKDNGTFIHIDVGYLIVPRLSWHWRRGARWQG